MFAAQLVQSAKDAGVVIATAESCTGGLIAGAITDVPGSSAVLDRGFVTYSNASKVALLGVEMDMINREGAVAECVAAAMASGALARSDAQMTIAVTGVAGPGGTDAKPEGMVCFGLASTRGVTTETQLFGAIGRDKVRQATVDHAVMLLLAEIARLYP